MIASGVLRSLPVDRLDGPYSDDILFKELALKRMHRSVPKRTLQRATDARTRIPATGALAQVCARMG